MNKLSNLYPTADAKQWLFFFKPEQSGIHPVFAGRLAALGKEMKKRIDIASGFRDIELQKKLYAADLAAHGGKPSGYVGRPGYSWHQYGCAIDAEDDWLKRIEQDAATKDQKTLLRFGLFKPLTKGNRCTVLENWHIQPIETAGIASGDLMAKQAFLDDYKKPIDLKMQTVKLGSSGEPVLFLQKQLSHLGYAIAIDGQFGEKTQRFVKEFQRRNGLIDDGIVGSATWAKIV